MSDFTHLESAVLQTICQVDAEDGNALRSLLGTAKVTKRDNTGVGFYTDFVVETDGIAHAIDSRFRVASARMQDMAEDERMCFTLWFKDGLPSCLEGYITGSTVDFKKRDLASLKFTQLDPSPQTP